MVGGGSLFFYAQEHSYAPQYWINDLNPQLVTFWQSSLDPWKVAIPVQGIYDRRHHKSPLEYLKVNDGSPIRFFIRNRCSFSGSTEAGGLSPAAGTGTKDDRFTRSSINRLFELEDTLKNVRITNLSVFEVLNEVNEDDFLYIDPPYVTAKKLYGPSGALHDFDHARLAVELQKTKAKFLLSYDDCDIVKDLYKWANIEEVTFNRSMSKKKQGKEVLISNYEYNIS
jgi:DNA adenine methylase